MSQTRNTAEVNVIDCQPDRSMAVPVTFFILAIIYLISPIDIIPDVPVVGQVDDFFITATATLNLLQKWLQNHSSFLASLLGFFKWLVIFAGIAAVSLIGIVVLGIAKIFMG